MADENEALDGIDQASSTAEGAETAVTQDVEAGSSTASDVAAESSTADEGVKKPESPLAAVMAALAKAEDGESPKPTGEGTESEQPAKAAEAANVPASEQSTDEADTKAEAEDAKLPFAKHPRFKRLLTERKEYKVKYEQTEAQLKEFAPKAENFDALTRYVRESNFSGEDFTNLLRFGRLMKNDPIAFHREFQSYWNQIEAAAGQRLPEDLVQKVKDGVIDQETAQELARKRAEAALNDRKVKEVQAERQRDQEMSEEQRVMAEIDAIGKSVSDWEQQWKQSDPDYARKQPFVMDRASRYMQQTPAKSAKDALQLVNKARAEINEHFKSLIPPKPTVRHIGSGTSVESKAQPKSPLEAAKMAIRMGGA